MNYLKKLLSATFPILITYMIIILILILFAVIYNLLGYNDINHFLSISPYLLIPSYIITIIILIKKYSIKINFTSLLKEKNFFYTSLGISLSIFLNMLIFKYFSIPKTKDSLKLIINIISSGLIGPIYEEILFRGIFYNKLLKFNSPKKSLIITTICFSLIHFSPIKMLYALVLGYIFTKIYQKDNNIFSSIIIHVSANITSIFLFDYNTYLLLFSLINLLLCICIIKKVD